MVTDRRRSPLTTLSGAYDDPESREVTTEEHIRGFIERDLLDEPFTGIDPLLELELDSLSIEQLIDFIEDEYGLLFAEEELASENFASVSVLAALVDAKRLDARGSAAERS